MVCCVVLFDASHCGVHFLAYIRWYGAAPGGLCSILTRACDWQSGALQRELCRCSGGWRCKPPGYVATLAAAHVGGCVRVCGHTMNLLHFVGERASTVPALSEFSLFLVFCVGVVCGLQGNP